MKPSESSPPAERPPESGLSTTPDDETPDEFEFTDAQIASARRGVFYEDHLRYKGWMKLDDDVRAAFPNEQAVNEALRTLMRIQLHREAA